MGNSSPTYRGWVYPCLTLDEKDKCEISIVRSSAAEYLTFAASTGDDKDSVEMRYEDENIWLTQK